jgi:hypothetical protein
MRDIRIAGVASLAFMGDAAELNRDTDVFHILRLQVA